MLFRYIERYGRTDQQLDNPMCCGRQIEGNLMERWNELEIDIQRDREADKQIVRKTDKQIGMPG